MYSPFLKFMSYKPEGKDNFGKKGKMQKKKNRLFSQVMLFLSNSSNCICFVFIQYGKWVDSHHKKGHARMPRSHR